MSARVRRFRTTVTTAARVVDNDRAMDTKAVSALWLAVCDAQVPDDVKKITVTVEEIER
jgi:hypothetical protein